MQQVRLPGFQPTRNGFQFTNNDWPAGPDYQLSILGQTISIGDASNGLCGGMAYAAADLYRAKLLPPPDSTPPANGTPLFNYIVARLTNSFDPADVARYLSWIQMSDHDSLIGGHGLAWHEISEEWPKIRADLDAGLPAPLGLVHGQEPQIVGFLNGWQHLKDCHQVLAWGYDLDGPRLTIHIYDPNVLSDDATITVDIGRPGDSSPLAVTGYPPGQFRGFFRTNYQYHDPRTPISVALGVTVVTSPGISSATAFG